MPSTRGDTIPLISGLAVGVGFIILFSLFSSGSISTRQPAISTVVFVEGASIPNAPNHGIEPTIIKVKIGINNTVRWINQDTIPHGAPMPNEENIDPDFAKASEIFYSGNGGASFLMPGGENSFQYTFTHPGRIDYHMVPHPQMQGAVIVLPAVP